MEKVRLLARGRRGMAENDKLKGKARHRSLGSQFWLAAGFPDLYYTLLLSTPCEHMSR